MYIGTKQVGEITSYQVMNNSAYLDLKGRRPEDQETRRQAIDGW